jgi:MFS family permease
MAQFMVVLDFTIVNVALPSIQHDFHVATTTLQWLVSAYAVAFGGFLLLGGRLSDAYGRARLYRIGLVVFVVASISGGLAVEPGLLIASRVVQGIGALGAVAIMLLAGFVYRERRARAPLLDLALLKDRGITGANLSLIAVGAFNAGQVLLTTLYLQEGRGLSPVLTGLCFIPQAAGAFALSGPAGRFVPALGARRALVIALSIALLALAGAAASVLAGSLAGLLAAQFAIGVAARLSQVASTLAGTRGPVAARSEGIASALLTAARQCGSAFGVAVVSALLVATHGSTGHRTAVAMFVAAGFALTGLLAAYVVPSGPPHPHQPQPHHLFHRHAGGIP